MNKTTRSLRTRITGSFVGLAVAATAFAAGCNKEEPAPECTGGQCEQAGEGAYEPMDVYFSLNQVHEDSTVGGSSVNFEHCRTIEFDGLTGELIVTPNGGKAESFRALGSHPNATLEYLNAPGFLEAITERGSQLCVPNQMSIEFGVSDPTNDDGTDATEEYSQIFICADTTVGEFVSHFTSLADAYFPETACRKK